MCRGSSKEDGGDYFDADGLDLYDIEFLKNSLDKQPILKPDTFFIPMTEEEIDKYPSDLTHEETKKSVERTHLI